jgi:NNP family nitrate/nitrite transporter-like MFS transporter
MTEGRAIMLNSKWITGWDPNDPTFWETRGKKIARRNLIFSILAEFLGFSVWQLWSIVGARLNLVGFHFTVSQIFWLVGVPVLVGSLLRLPYGAAVPIFGGRNWTAISALLLLVPTILLAILVQRPSTPYWAMVLAAATAGFGGGNFASSMSNISFFYPDKRKGWALGLNAAGGNIGVAVVQFVVPFAIGAGILGLILAPALKKATKAAATYHTSVAAQLQAQGFHLHLEYAGLIWVPLILISTLCAIFFMDNLAVARSTVGAQAVILRRTNTWVMSLLYIGTFGSFIGYSAAFPTLINSQFPTVNFLQFAFLGPLVGSLARPLGGWLSDRIGGTVVTFGNFMVMGVAALGVIIVLNGHNPKTNPADFTTFLLVFLALFVTAGVGNGSTFRMIPPLYLNDRLKAAAGRGAAALEQADHSGRKEAAAALAFTSAIGAFGGFFIPIGFAQSIATTHSVVWAMTAFALFYLVCVTATYAFYMRTRHEHVAVPSLAPEAGAA